jgi:hypothetical protein
MEVQINWQEQFIIKVLQVMGPKKAQHGAQKGSKE